MGFYVVSVFRTNQLWRQAAVLSGRVVEELPRSLERDRLLILNAPDNLRGVPVFHNGLPEGLHYSQNQNRVSQVEILTFERLESVADEVAVNQASLALTIELANQKEDILRVAPVECLHLVSQSKTTLNLETKPCWSESDVFFFSHGRMLRLNRQ